MLSLRYWFILSLQYDQLNIYLLSIKCPLKIKLLGVFFCLLLCAEQLSCLFYQRFITENRCRKQQLTAVWGWWERIKTWKSKQWAEKCLLNPKIVVSQNKINQASWEVQATHLYYWRVYQHCWRMTDHFWFFFFLFPALSHLPHVNIHSPATDRFL